MTPQLRRHATRFQERYRRELSIAFAYLLLLVFVAWAAPSFYSFANLRDLVITNAPILVVATGMTLVILVGHIDISVGAQFAICSVAAGLLAKAGIPVPLVAPLLLLIGGLLGMVNGVMVAHLNIPSIVVTLATMVALRDALRWWTEGAWVQNLPADFQWFGLGQSVGQWLIVLIAFALFAVSAWCMRNLRAGRLVYAVGSNREAARLLGARPSNVVFVVFTLTGVLVALSAMLNSIRFVDVQSNAGIGLELKAIAATVVGGTSIAGGRGTLIGTLLGVALLGTIGTALTFLGINPYWEKAIQGLIILAAVSSEAAFSRIKAGSVAWRTT